MYKQAAGVQYLLSAQQQIHFFVSLWRSRLLHHCTAEVISPWPIVLQVTNSNSLQTISLLCYLVSSLFFLFSLSLSLSQTPTQRHTHTYTHAAKPDGFPLKAPSEQTNTVHVCQGQQRQSHGFRNRCVYARECICKRVTVGECVCVAVSLGAYFTAGCVLVLALTLVTLKVPLKVQTTTSVPNKSLTTLLCAQLVCPSMHVAFCN